MGEVVTPYHTLKLGMATERHRLEQVRDSHDGLCLFHHRLQEAKEEMKGSNLNDFEAQLFPLQSFGLLLTFITNGLLLTRVCFFGELQVEESVHVTEQWVLSMTTEELLSQVRTTEMS